MWNGVDTLYGNEWINYDQPYFKIKVAEDGIYRLPFQTLLDNGVPVNDLQASQYQLYYFGQEVPLYTSTTGALAAGDYLEFYGQKNRSELDRFLFQNPDTEMLNPEYSLFTDTSAYFLTWVPVGTPTARYVEVENELVDLPGAEEWFWGEEKVVYNQSLGKVHNRSGSTSIYFSHFDSDGFANSPSTTHEVTIPAPAVYANGPTANLSLRMVSNFNTAGHKLQILVNGIQEVSEEFTGAQLRFYNFPKSPAQLGASVTLNVNGLNESNDRYQIALASLRYPRLFDFVGLNFYKFQLENAVGGRYLEINNFNTADNPILYDLSNSLRMTGAVENGTIRLKLPSAAGERKLVLAGSGSFTNLTALEAVNFIDYRSPNTSFIIISNRVLFDNGNGQNWVQAYADYRASADGGNFNTLVAEIHQLYDQYAYGVQRHPLAIRNFTWFAKRIMSNPQHVFLIGKSREYSDIRTNSQLNSPVNASFYIPTFGRPGADNLLVASVNSDVPILPIGRIPVSNAQEIKQYLDKVIGYEANAQSQEATARNWRKEVIHLGGGGGASEQNSIRGYLNTMGTILENNSFGANITSLFKTSPDPIQQSQSQQLTNRINKGTGIITFFGHSSTSGFDFSLDNPSTYLNENRYPVLFSLGCLSGQIHGGFKSVGEDFIFQEKKGSIAFFATTGFGFVSTLNTFNQAFYNALGTSNYGKGIGVVNQATIAQYDNQQGYPMRTLIQQFTLNGDPSIVINPFDAPDYWVEPESVKFLPEVITAQQDSFQISFSVNNSGKAINENMWIEIHRRLPDGSEILAHRQKISTPAYSNEFTLKLPSLETRAIGFNTIFIKIDTENEIAELPLPSAENNNELVNSLGMKGIQFYVFANGIRPVMPAEFSIVGSSPINLKANTADLFAPEQNYVLEIDTTAYFNSNLKRQKKILQKGGVVEWSPDIPLLNNTVYYWRVSPDSTAQFGYIWDQSSFLYLDNGEAGWNQSHFFQFEKDAFNNMEIKEGDRHFKYLDDVKTVRVRNGVYPYVWPIININSDPYVYLPWDDPIKGGIYVCVLDSLTADPWINNPPGDYGSHVSPWAYWASYPYWTRTTEERELVINLLRDTIPSGNYVLVYTVQQENYNYEPEEWAADSLTLGTNLFRIFEEQGATQIRGTAESGALPYVFFYKKNDPDFPIYERVVGLTDSIVEIFSIPGIWDEGLVKSTKIGPAKSWDKLLWNAINREDLDEISIDVLGVRNDSTTTLLIENLQAIDTTLSWISAAEYPYLQLIFNSRDTSHRTSPHLAYWRVIYTGLPDASLAPNEFLSFHADTLQQGDPFKLEMAIRNISNYPMDSLLVNYTLFDKANNQQIIKKRFARINGQDSIITYFQLDSKPLGGSYKMIIEANPDGDQPELFQFNNVAFKDFYVERDKRNPVLDVTFDGIHILEGDIVSPKPRIVITLRDENPFLALSDTSVLRVFLERPDFSDPEAIAFTSSELQFYPASISGNGQKNMATIEYNPELLEDGTYALRVQAQDVSGNASGQLDYKIAFEVITETAISNVVNYPNPFSTSTRFVYTLTGADPPVDFMIRIMTVSGRVVRELTQADLGMLRIGTHQTEGTWDGTDQYGDRLANGVYLYQVFARDADGKPYEKYDNGTDRFFKYNIGKLVILR
ncbi:MAG: hypothetical protein DHS20C18_25000 [Saprospiraceae bacterium]|nr:MAG: hypothetical protein DHS20C18_25000 [Saprospiraceae bacterium]